MIDMLGIEALISTGLKGISVHFLVDSRGRNKVMCQPSDF